MAESRRRYVWTARWEDSLSPVAAQPTAALAVARTARRHSWLQAGTVSVEGDELRVELTIRAADQWRVHEYQLRTIGAVAAAIRISRNSFGEPDIHRLPHHRQLALRCTTSTNKSDTLPPG